MIKGNNDKAHFLALLAMTFGLVLIISIVINIDYKNFDRQAPIILGLLIALGLLFFAIPLKVLKQKKEVLINKKQIILKKHTKEKQTFLLKDLISWHRQSLRYSTGIHLSFKEGKKIFLDANELSNFFTIQKFLSKNFKSKLIK